MKSTYKVRISYPQVCKLLNISPVELRYLMLNDLSFPKPLQTGTANQPTLFDYVAVVSWYKQKNAALQLQSKHKQA